MSSHHLTTYKIIITDSSSLCQPLLRCFLLSSHFSFVVLVEVVVVVAVVVVVVDVVVVVVSSLPNEISKLLGAPLMSEITTIINLTCILCELDKRLFQEMQISTVVKYNMMNLQDTPHQQPSRCHS